MYGTAVFLAGTGTWFFAFWYAVAALLIGAGWMARTGIIGAWPASLKGACIAVLAVLAVCLCVTLALQAREFDDEGQPDLDYIVVLGALVRDDGPSVVLRYRLDTAYDYLVENERTLCVVSGGRGANEPAPEAEVMAAYLVDRGIDPKRIVLEGESENTVENLKNSMSLMEGAGSFGIVTNDFHVYRSVAIARKLGAQGACGISAPSNPFFLPNNMMRESLGIAKDFAFGNI